MLRNTHLPHQQSYPAHQLQWGRSSYAAEYIDENGKFVAIYVLQWGRSSYAAEYSHIMILLKIRQLST